MRALVAALLVAGCMPARSPENRCEWGQVPADEVVLTVPELLERRVELDRQMVSVRGIYRSVFEASGLYEAPEVIDHFSERQWSPYIDVDRRDIDVCRDTEIVVSGRFFDPLQVPPGTVPGSLEPVIHATGVHVLR